MTVGKGYSLERKLELKAYMFIIIPVLMFIVFRIAPTIFSFVLSLTDWSLLSPNKSFVGYQNYVTIFQNRDFVKSLWNTCVYVIIGVPIMIILGLILALMLSGITKGRALLRLPLIMPYVTSVVAVSWVWKWMFMSNGGFINGMLNILGIPSQPFLHSTSQAIYVVMSNVIWSRIGFNAIILLAGILQISKSFYEAADIDGATWWDKFRYITIPQLNPTLIYISVMCTIWTLQVFTQIYNIADYQGGPLKSTTAIVLEIYNEAFYKYHMGTASAMSVVLFIIIMLITLFQMKVLSRDTE